jgi:hypothetical protein
MDIATSDLSHVKNDIMSFAIGTHINLNFVNMMPQRIIEDISTALIEDLAEYNIKVIIVDPLVDGDVEIKELPDSDDSMELVDFDALFDEIMSSPMTSSGYGDYIREHRDVFEQLVELDVETLKYCFDLFEDGDQTGLKGWIMMSVCRDILFEYDISLDPLNGQNWYDEITEHTQKITDLNGVEFIEENYPPLIYLLDNE